MKTTVELPDKLVDDVRRVAGDRPTEAVIIEALEEFVRVRGVEWLRAMLGRLDLDLTQEELEAMRAED